MFQVPVGKKYIATTQGSAWKPVTCKYCGCQFVYRMNITVEGEATSLLWMTNSGSANAARTNAEIKLNRSLHDEKMAVSCPECGKYQTDMVAKIVNKEWKSSGSLALLFLVSWVILMAFSPILFGYNVPSWWGYVTFLGLAAIWARACLPSLIKVYQSNSEANFITRASQTASNNILVLRKAEFEELQAQTDKSHS